MDWLDFDLKFPSPIYDHLVHITKSPVTHHNLRRGTWTGPNCLFSQLGVGGCMVALVQSNSCRISKTPNWKTFEPDVIGDHIEMEMPDEGYDWALEAEFEAPFSFTNIFRGLENLVITMPDCRHPGTMFEGLDRVHLVETQWYFETPSSYWCMQSDKRWYVSIWHDRVKKFHIWCFHGLSLPGWPGAINWVEKQKK